MVETEEEKPNDSAFDTHNYPRRDPIAQQQIHVFLETGLIKQFCNNRCEKLSY